MSTGSVVASMSHASSVTQCTDAIRQGCALYRSRSTAQFGGRSRGDFWGFQLWRKGEV